MPDPAVSFKRTVTHNSRGMQATATSSPLYILHKDWSKYLTRPFSVQSIIDGDTANNQYQVLLNVPSAATHVGLFWVNQVVLSDTGASVNSLSAKLGTGSMTGYGMRVFGLINPDKADDRFGPYEAGLANAVTINNAYGYWRPLANIQLTVNSASEMFSNVSTTTASTLNYKVSTTRRLLISPIVNGGVVASMSFSSNNQPLQTAATTISASSWDSCSGLIPVKGCEKIVLIPEAFGTGETTTITGAVTAGSISSVDFTAIGAMFHS